MKKENFLISFIFIIIVLIITSFFIDSEPLIHGGVISLLATCAYIAIIKLNYDI